MDLRKRGGVKFSEAEQKRLHDACVALSCYPEQLVHFATLQALDELEGYARDARAIAEFYGNLNGGRRE